jgi:hypothetical protein
VCGDLLGLSLEREWLDGLGFDCVPNKPVGQIA